MQRIGKRFFAVLAVAAATGLTLPASAQQYGDKDYSPSVGQEGKDVIWVPTPMELIARMLDMAKLTPNDIHFDLGSGDGRTVIAGAKRGAQSTGVEFNPDMVALSNRSAAKEGVAGKAKFINGDIFQTDFSKATVLTLYLLPSLNLKLRPTILNMKPGTRVVSHAFTMGEWEADQTETVEGRTAYLWIVPAKVEGNWQVTGPSGRGYELALKQSFQKIEGSGRYSDGKSAPIAKAAVRGDLFTFSIDGRDYAGRVSGERMEGTAKTASGEVKWTATRTK